VVPLKHLAREAARAAFETRFAANLSLHHPLCIYDLCATVGVDVRFCTLPSFEGMFLKASQTILISSLRPPGRQAFTCAHELGHWFFQHGDRLDELLSSSPSPVRPPEEVAADIFAAYVLMPAAAITRAFARRAIEPNKADPLTMYSIAGQLGVGFESLVVHLHRSLAVLSPTRARLLRATPLSAIRSSIDPSFSSASRLLIADQYWEVIPIDLNVGDLLLLPPDSTAVGSCIESGRRLLYWNLYHAVAPGTGVAECVTRDWSSSIRVSRSSFEGRAIYRHLEDPDAD
jgi:Zn-dependent peptidase ImmA (M78 family)